MNFVKIDNCVKKTKVVKLIQAQIKKNIDEDRLHRKVSFRELPVGARQQKT